MDIVAFKTADIMITQRGYSKSDLVPSNEHKVNIYFNSDNKQYLMLYKFIIDRFNVDQYKFFTIYINNIEKELGINIQNSIVIYSESVTPMAKKYVDSYKANLELELFFINELQYNITKHRLVPTHIRLNAEETKLFNQTLSVSNIPTILTTDPISKFYNYKIGDIIKIIRNNGIVVFKVVKK